MGAIGIDRKLVDMTLESLTNKVFFVIHCHIVEDGLDRMSALLMAADLNKIISDQIQDAKALVN